MAEADTASRRAWWRVVLITPGDRPAEATARLARACLDGGVTAVLLREPAMAFDARRRLAEQLRGDTSAAGAALIVSRDVDLALDVGADGVQLGHGSVSVAEARVRGAAQGAPLAVGRSAHWPLTAEDDAADALMLSPFAATPRSHPRPLLTDEQVAAVLARAAGRPVVALGGVTVEHVPRLDPGLAGVAVIRALAGADDPTAAAAALRRAVEARGAGA